MRSFLLIALTAAGGLLAMAQQSFFSCDFENGIPAEMALYDRDGNEPSAEMKELGFAVGTPWIAVDLEEGGKAASSTSWYRKAGQSDDWMVTPAIDIASTEAVLRWRAKATDKEYRDGYAVYISTQGNTPDKFDTSAPLFSVRSENAAWNAREVSLAQYAGKKIYIAFVNNTRDRSRLLIDDIYAGVPSVLEIHSILPRVINTPGRLDLIGEITNTSDKEISEYTVKYRLGDGITGEETMTRPIKAGATRQFRLATNYEIGKNETLAYEISVVCGKDASSDTGKVSAYCRRVVAEEVTGVWCGYCVRGIYAMALMKKDFPDSFLGIAVHNGSPNWADPMAMPEYTDWLFDKFNMGGYPHCTVNRLMSSSGDPGNIQSYYSKAMDTENFTGLGLDADVNITDRKITAKTDLFTAQNLEDIDYSLAYVLIENDVHSDEVIYKDGKPLPYNGWEQNNYYAGGGMGSLGGFENLPEIIPGAEMTYQDVARYISPDYNGIEGSVPSSLAEGESAHHEFTFDIPKTVMKDENTELAVLLINRKNSSIINAEVLPLKDIIATSGISAAGTDAHELTVYSTAAGFVFESEAGIESVTLYSTDGSMIANVPAAGQSCEVEMEKGRMAIASVILSDGTRVSRKLIR